MSFEFVFFNLIVGAIVFFFLRWILEGIIRENHTLRIALTWIGTIIITLGLYTIIVVAFLSSLFYQPAKPFNRDQWFADKTTRYEMRDDLIGSQLLIGKNKVEVVNLIGPAEIQTDSVWRYDLGTSTAGFGWQFNSLIITFDGTLVGKVEKKEIAD